MGRWSTVGLAACASLVAGCGEVLLPDAGADAGLGPDAKAPAVDAGHTDAAPDDAGALDARTPDAEPNPDAGALDAGARDAEPPPDAGTPDASPLDASAPDAGPPDAGAPDAGPQTFTLSLGFAGDGTGDVRWPDNTTCNTACTRTLPAGSRIRLEATADATSELASWSVAGCTGPTCEVDLDRDRSVQVTFLARYEVTVTPAGDGLGRTDGLGALCAPTCTAEHTSGTSLTVTAVPATGTRFAGWSAGPCTGVNPSCTFQVTGPTTLTPEWTLELPQLTQGTGGHLCALLAPRSIRCWGNGGVGQLGRDSTANIGDDETIASAGDLPLGLDVVQVAAGGTHSCVLQRSGSVRCWGSNGYGQLGQGNTTSIGDGTGPSPANVNDVSLGGPAMQIAMGAWHTCARMATGAVRCWGRGSDGQLGYGSPFDIGDASTSLPSTVGDVPLGAPATYIAAGNTHTCAVLTSGEVKCWGNNQSGQLGYPLAVNVGDGNATWPTPATAPVLPLGRTDPVEIKAGFRHTCVRFSTGEVRCWGANDVGQLGDGTFLAVGGPTGRSLSAVTSGVSFQSSAASAIGVGFDHSCALTGTGQVWCWGSGQHGKTGYQATANLGAPPGPVLLPAQRRAIALGMVGLATCTIAEVGPTFASVELYCWGFGMAGALGGGTNANVGDTMGSMPPSASPLF